MMLAVITPAASKDLTTLSTVKAELGIVDSSQDAKLSRLIQEASSAIVDYLKRELAQETVEETLRLEEHHEDLFLQRWPVVSITTITEDGVTLQAADYELNKSNAILTRLRGDRVLWWPARTKIVIRYVAGYALLDGVPHAIERAALELMKHWYYASRRDPQLRSVDVEGIAAETYFAPGDRGLPPAVAGLLGPHRNRTAR